MRSIPYFVRAELRLSCLRRWYVMAKNVSCLRKRRAWLIPALLLLSSCAKMVVYTSADTPLHQGTFAEHLSVRPDSFTVVSYNIQYGEDIDLALADIQSEPRLRSADVFLLQEMDPEGTETLARALNLHYVYFPASVHPHHARLFGNAVLSRWPITHHSVSILPHGHPFSGHRRIAVAADLDVGGHTLRVVSVHTATVVTAQDLRLEQARAALDSLAAVDGPVVIGGDFNTIADFEHTLVRRLFRRSGFLQARLPTGPTVKWGLRKVLGLELVLDHIFFHNLQLRRTGIAQQAIASDHLPIWAVFTW